jgi:hypothetical protein
MIENLIETVAEAAFAATRRAPWSEVDPEVKPLLLIEAKAAMLATLEGIREPTEAIRWAGRVHEPGTVDDPFNIIPGTVWHAMIDALRAEIESAA